MEGANATNNTSGRWPPLAPIGSRVIASTANLSTEIMSGSSAALPMELLICIMGNVTSQSTLCSLARCSHLLYLLVIPLLYRHVTMQKQGGCHNRQSGNLAILLIRRPDLARLVRNFTLLRPSTNSASSLGNPDDCDDDDEELEGIEAFEEHGSRKIGKIDQAFKTAVKAVCLTRKQKLYWMKRISCTHRCPRGFLIALLLSALLKVEKVVLETTAGSQTLYLERMIQKAARRARPCDVELPFEMLTVFAYEQGMSPRLNVEFIARLLKLPAIREISGGFNSTYSDRRDLHGGSIKSLREFVSSSSSVTRLDLAAHALTPNLRHMLRVPKALNHFSFQFCASCRINFTRICRALEPQKNSLESLGFGYNSHYEKTYGTRIGNIMECREISARMPLFVGFNGLRVFKSAMLFLQTTDGGTGRHNLINIFPPTLETLHITRVYPCLVYVLEAVEYLLAHKSPQQIPLLTKLVLEEAFCLKQRVNILMDLVLRDAQERVIERLALLAAAQGVSLNVISINDEEPVIGANMLSQVDL